MSKEAMKLAFEALERYQVKRQDFERFADVIAALEEALAKQEQGEPVALQAIAKRRVFDAIRGAYDLGYNDAKAINYKGRDVEKDHGDALIHALERYTTPQQRKPLWIDPNDKTQAKFLPSIGEPVVFCCRGETYIGIHTGGGFQDALSNENYFNTWSCRWMPIPFIEAAHGIKG